MIQRDIAVLILINPWNEALIQKKDLRYNWASGKWGLPGGEIEEGEDPSQTIEREIREEYGHEIQLRELSYLLTADYEDRIGDKIRGGKEHVFTAHFDGDISKLRVKEGAGFAMFAESELDSIPLIEHDKRVLTRFYDSLRKS